MSPASISPRMKKGLLGLFLMLPVVLVLVASARRAHLDDPAPTVLLIDRDGEFLAEIGVTDELGSGYWPVDEVPWRVAAATVAIEDRRFARHPGVDPQAVGRALLQDLRAGHTVSGASTLAMQVARMQDPGRRTVGNKAIEATTAMMLTARYGRDPILAQYLRYAPYGHGIHGIAYAARRYLDKPVEDLSWAEISFLCAIPQSPSRMDPFTTKGKKLAIDRARRILGRLVVEGVIAADEEAAANLELDELRVPDRLTRPRTAIHAIIRIERELGDPDVRRGLQSPIVVANLDIDVQAMVATHVRESVDGWEAKGAGNAAAIVVDLHTGHVLAHVGSADYFDEEHHGAIDYTQVRRNAGSTLKPFLYALALDRGVITPTSILDDLGHGEEGIEDSDTKRLGPLLPRQALGNSRNVPAVALISQVGPESQWALLRELGLHHDTEPLAQYGVGLAIGALPVRLEELTEAYLAVAGDGRIRQLAYVGDPPEPTERVLSERSARTVTGWLADPQARMPTFARGGPADMPFPVALKTGTSSDWRDAWTVAWTEDRLVAVWVGDPGNQPMAHLSGMGAAAVLARRILMDLEPEGPAVAGGFPDPPDTLPVRVCALSGMKATEACDHSFVEHVPKGQLPERSCDVHVRRELDGVVRTFVDLPPKYRAWQVGAGLPRPPEQARELSTADRLVDIVEPRDGTRILRDPEAPAGRGTIALAATVDPPVPQLVWYVDGEPVALVDDPYTARWALEPGEHAIEARVPFTDLRSERVHVVVR